MFSIMWWWSLTFALLCAIRLDLSDAAAAAKSSSSSQRSDKFEVLRNSDNSYSNEKSDKSQQTGDGNNNGALKGGGDIIPIPDHLLKSDYDDHHYSYEDEHLEGYDDYEYHSNSGKNLHLYLHFIFYLFFLYCTCLPYKCLYKMSYNRFNQIRTTFLVCDKNLP